MSSNNSRSLETNNRDGGNHLRLCLSRGESERARNEVTSRRCTEFSLPKLKFHVWKHWCKKMISKCNNKCMLITCCAFQSNSQFTWLNAQQKLPQFTSHAQIGKYFVTWNSIIWFYFQKILGKWENCNAFFTICRYQNVQARKLSWILN